MGRERNCTARIGRKTYEGRALLETADVIFRADDLRLRVPLGAVRSVEVHGGDLVLQHQDGTLTLSLGDEAPKWAAAITKPKGRIEKLGVKPGQRVAVLAVSDDAFEGELRAIVGELSGTQANGLDALFFGANAKKELDELPALRARIAEGGAIWVVRPKGGVEITEKDVMSAARECGLVDVKVVRFSDTHTAEKLVIPVAARAAGTKNASRSTGRRPAT